AVDMSAYDEYNYDAERYLGGKGGKGRSKRAAAEHKLVPSNGNRQDRIAVEKLRNNRLNSMAKNLHPGPKTVADAVRRKSSATNNNDGNNAAEEDIDVDKI
ncbi:hypothetical protein BOX15_Mlig020924g14, partial [Macrostomum lignano]